MVSRACRRFATLQPLLLIAVMALVFGLGSFAHAAGEPPPAAHGESYLSWIARCSGLIGLVILFLSMYFVATVTRLFMELRPSEASPPALVEQCEMLVQHRDLQSVYRVMKESDSFLGRVLSSGMSELGHGLAEAREALERASDAETVQLEKKISILAVLGTLGPMIGLLGTLKGMISSFSVIAMSGVNIEASKVAGGISEALLLTFEGVALSVPAIYFFSVFRNRVATISATTTLTADRLLRKVYHAARSKTAAAGAPPVAAPVLG